MEQKKPHFLYSLIAEGEHEHQDFKYQISDAKKIARSISAFANNSGGHLLVGVKDNGRIAGISSDEEVYMIEQAASRYCRPEQTVHCRIYRIEGKNVLKVDIDEASTKPVKAPDENGNWTTYYRIADENIVASSIHVKALRHSTEQQSRSAVCYTEVEQSILSYLSNHGAISIEGIMKLTHCSRLTAESSIVNLYDLHLLSISYHGAQCTVSLAD